MKKFGLVAILFFPALLSAAEYLGNAKGVAMISALQREMFSFVAGTLGDCRPLGTITGTDSDIVSRECDVNNASVTISNGAGQSQTMKLQGVLISDFGRAVPMHDYDFWGTWIDDKAGISDKINLNLHERANMPGRIWGDLQFHAYHFSYGIEALLE